MNNGYRVKEGPRVYVERIDISGNTRTLDKVIRREFRLSEGDAFSTAKVRRSQQRLKNLGFFEKIDIQATPGSTADIANILRETKTDVVVNYLPVGSEMATKWYVEQILDAGCAFVNCIPVFIAREAYWRRRFEDPD